MLRGISSPNEGRDYRRQSVKGRLPQKDVA